MPTKFVEGNLFDYAETHVLGQGVNCQGAMAAGIAAQFRQRFPRLIPFYEHVCSTGHLKPGGLLPWSGIDQTTGVFTFVANCASQNFPGADASLDWLLQSLYLARSYARSVDRPLAIPMIGCGIGGLSEGDAAEIFFAVGIPIAFELLVVTFTP